jgi:hypothetical protein
VYLMSSCSMLNEVVEGMSDDVEEDVDEMGDV